MTFGSVCSGIEAASVAWLPLGWKCAFVAEIERFPCSVLKHHYPDVPNYGDITKFKDWPDHAIDVLIGGTPCQSFSVAGLRKGISDPRGNLALTFLAIADRYRPRWILWENVPGVHSSWTDEKVRPPTKAEEDRIRAAGGNPDDYEYAEQSNDFDCFLSGMEELGYGVATAILDAQYFNLAQRRERVFVVGHIGGQWQRAAAVLFDGSCMRGDPAPSRKAGKRVAPTISARTKGGGGLGTDAELDGAVIAIPEISLCLNGGGMGRIDSESETMIPVAHALRADGFDASEDGTGRGTPLVPVTTLAIRGRADGSSLEFRDDGLANAVLTPNGGRAGIGVGAIQHGWAVRRLTPEECEILQGFPRGYTKLNDKTADGPRYKALGNSMAVPVIRYIGERIQLVDTIP